MNRSKSLLILVLGPLTCFLILLTFTTLTRAEPVDLNNPTDQHKALLNEHVCGVYLTRTIFPAGAISFVVVAILVTIPGGYIRGFFYVLLAIALGKRFYDKRLHTKRNS